MKKTNLLRAIFASALFGLGTAPGYAEVTEPVEMTYEVYFGGFHVLSARAALKRDTKNFTLSADAESTGILDFFFTWRGKTETAGQFADLSAVPIKHKNFGEWNGSTRTVEVTYDPSGAVSDITVEPPTDPDEINALPEDAEVGTVDPLSVIAQMSEAITRGGACDGAFNVFDGKRRYDLSVTDQGPTVFEPNDFSVFDGEAKACFIEYTLLGGDRKEKSKYAKTARNRVVYVGRPLEEAPAIPVRLQIDTSYGMLMAHLTSVSAGGKQLALSDE